LRGGAAPAQVIDLMPPSRLRQSRPGSARAAGQDFTEDAFRGAATMKQHPFEASITAICWTPLVLMGSATPPRDPDEDEEDEEDEDDEDGDDEPAVVREPDED
jgi:hypothetical protein